MYRVCCTLLTLGWAVATGLAGDGPAIRYSSPNQHFALRITPPGADSNENKVELIEKASGKVLLDLGVAYGSHVADTVLLWSVDSKRVAYATRDNREGQTSVYFWNGSAFDEVTLPENLPEPDIRFAKGAGESVKNYGGGTKPVRWLKSGELELSSDTMMLSRVDDRSYTGMVTFTIRFDKEHHASVGKVGKSKTTVDN